MKNILTILIFLSVNLLVSQSSPFDKGYADGFEKGYCLEDDQPCSVPSITIPDPKDMQQKKSYSDGYAKGIIDGEAKRGVDNKEYANATPIYDYASGKIDGENSIYDSAMNGSSNNSAIAAIDKANSNILNIAAKNEIEFKKIPLKELDRDNNLNRYKYMVILEKQKHSKTFIKEYLKYKNKLPILVYEKSTLAKENGGLKKFINLNPESFLFVSSVQSTYGYNTTYVNLQLVDMNKTKVYSGTGAKLMGLHKGAIKQIIQELVENGGIDYAYDENLGLLPKANELAKNEKKSEKIKIDKDQAIKELKQLKELYDSGLLTLQEYDKKAIELKKIILD